MSVAERQRELVERFSALPDRHERLAAIVDRARKSAPLSPDQKTAAQRVPGCVSPVWLATEFRDGRLFLRSDADSPVVKGLVALLCELYDGATPADIAATEPTLFADLDVDRDLSPTRRHGLAAVRARLREIARSLASPS